MIRNLKALGLAMVAVFAMSAVVASSASADATGSFTANAYPTAIHGLDTGAEDFFEAIGVKIQCTTDTFTATATAKSVDLTVTPTYTGCKLGEAPATVTMNGCDYLFHGNGLVDLKCPVGKVVEVHGYTSAAHTTSNCTVTVNPKNNMGTVTYQNVAGGVTVAGTVTGIEGTVHGGSCSLGLTVNFNNAKYVTSAEVKPTTAGRTIDVGA